MVASPQRANAEPPPFRIDIRQTFQILDGNLAGKAMRRASHRMSAWHMGPDDPIQQGEIHLRPFQGMYQHTAADIHPDQIRYDLVGNRHRRADGAAGAGVRIRHDPDSAAPDKFLVAEFLNLFLRHLFQLIGEHYRFVELAPNCFHAAPFSFPHFKK